MGGAALQGAWATAPSKWWRGWAVAAAKELRACASRPSRSPSFAAPRPSLPQAKYERKMKMLRDDMELRRKHELHEVRARVGAAGAEQSSWRVCVPEGRWREARCGVATARMRPADQCLPLRPPG